MRRVVVTGMGIVSSIGSNTQEVLASLREAKSGISRADKYAELGFRCQVHGAPTLNAEEAIDRRAMRFLGGGAAWNHVAMEQAIRDAGLEDGDISHDMTGIIMGSGGPSTRAIVEAADTARTKSPKRVGPFAVPKAMSSTASARAEMHSSRTRFSGSRERPRRISMRSGNGVAISESMMPYRAAQTFVALFPIFGSDSCFARVKSISSAAANHSGKRATSTSSVTSKRRPRWYPGASCSGVAAKTSVRRRFNI